MIRMMTVAGMLWAVAATAATADQQGRAANIKVSCNQNGAALTLKTGRKLYLGKQCDAFAPAEGTGRWWYAASALVARTGETVRRFEFDIDCPALPFCRPE